MAVSQLSPGVVVQERDFTTVSTAAVANIGAIAGPFERGPVEEIVEISSERNLLSFFGRPNNDNYEYWFTGAQFLSYGGTLKVIRTDATALKNAVSGGSAIKIKNLQDYETSYETSTNNWEYAVKTPGTYGNSVRVYVTDAGPDWKAMVTPDAGTVTAEPLFPADHVLSAAGPGGTTATGKVYKYSVILTLDNIVGTFKVTGNSSIDETRVTASSTDYDGISVRAYDAVNKKLEVYFDTSAAQAAHPFAHLIEGGDLISQSKNSVVTASADIVTVDRILYIVQDASSTANFAQGDDLYDGQNVTVTPLTTDNLVTVGSIVREYETREYAPGSRWATVAARPGTTRYTELKGGRNDELHILIVDADGKLTGTPGTLLEKFIGVSKASDAKTTVGEDNYYARVLKDKSAYVYWGAHEASVFQVGATLSAGNWGAAAANAHFNLLRNADGVAVELTGDILIDSYASATVLYTLTGGVDSYSQTNSHFSTAYDLISDPESQSVDFILCGPSGADNASAVSKAQIVLNIATARKDCLAFVSPMRSNIVGRTNTVEITDKIVEFFDSLPGTSYGVFDSGYKYIYDKYNDVYRYVPCNGDVAGLCLETSTVADPWYSPAGFARGVMRNAIKVAFSPNKTQRDKLYAARVNPIVSFPGQGVVLFGDKTAQGFASAFDRINVRRLFLTIERVIKSAARAQLFEQNDETSRSLFRNIVEPYLRDVQGRRGVTDFLVKCDDENNPPDAVDRGEFYAEIYVKPTRTINYITLTFTATRTGVAFSEIAS